MTRRRSQPLLTWLTRRLTLTWQLLCDSSWEIDAKNGRAIRVATGKQPDQPRVWAKEVPTIESSPTKNTDKACQHQGEPSVGIVTERVTCTAIVHARILGYDGVFHWREATLTRNSRYNYWLHTPRHYRTRMKFWSVRMQYPTRHESV